MKHLKIYESFVFDKDTSKKMDSISNNIKNEIVKIKQIVKNTIINYFNYYQFNSLKVNWFQGDRYLNVYSSNIVILELNSGDKISLEGYKYNDSGDEFSTQLDFDDINDSETLLDIYKFFESLQTEEIIAYLSYSKSFDIDNFLKDFDELELDFYIESQSESLLDILIKNERLNSYEIQKKMIETNPQKFIESMKEIEIDEDIRKEYSDIIGASDLGLL